MAQAQDQMQAPFFHVSQVGSMLEILLRENQIIIYQDCKASGEAVGFQVLDDLSGPRWANTRSFKDGMITKHERIGEIHQLYPSHRLVSTQDMSKICSGSFGSKCSTHFVKLQGEVSLEDGIHCTSLRMIPVLFTCQILPGTRTFVCSGLSLSKHDDVLMGLVAPQVPVEDGPGAGSLIVR